jgi:hypothetical protein
MNKFNLEILKTENMELIKKIGKIELHFEPLQRMYFIKKGFEQSFWFDSHTKEELVNLNDADFTRECKSILKASKNQKN